MGMCECEYVKEIMRKKMTTPDHFLCGCTVHSLKCFVSALPSFVTLNMCLYERVSVCLYEHVSVCTVVAHLSMNNAPGVLLPCPQWWFETCSKAIGPPGGTSELFLVCVERLRSMLPVCVCVCVCVCDVL